METREQVRSNGCPTMEIASYVDGELDPARELELENHFASCGSCADELNLQKQFLCALSSTLTGESEIELPANFAEKIVANAESSVSGLRKPIERFNALFICSALLLFVLFAIGADASALVGRGVDILDKISAVGGFVGHVIYSILLGVGVVLRSLTGPMQLPAAAVFVVLGMASLVLFRFSRVLIRFRRT